MSTVVIIIMGIISYKSCDIYINHLKKNEFDIQEILKRIMGKYLTEILLNVYYLHFNIFKEKDGRCFS